MSKTFRWYWEAIGGPHTHLTLAFEKGSAAAIYRKASELLPREFRLYGQNKNNQFWTRPDSREWDYLNIALWSDRLEIEHGWMLRGEADVRFLQQLFDADDFAIDRWRVETGGDIYPQHYIDTGLGMEDFVAYCAGDIEEEPLYVVEEQLHILLAKHGWSETYRLGAVSTSGGRTIFPLLYDVPRTCDGGYDARSSSPELNTLARELCELCHVRTSASGTGPRDPVTKEVVGGSIRVIFREP